MKIGSVGEIISLFRDTDGRKPILLLGAGASYRSGIPTSKDAVYMIARASYARSIGAEWRNSQIPPTDFIRYLNKQDWYSKFSTNPPEAFPTAVKELLNPTQFRRDFLKEMIKYQRINEGYINLSKIVQRRLCNIILTTNFDSLLIESFRSQYPNFPEIIEINKTSDENIAYDPLKCMIVYLHGAVEYYTDRVLEEETQFLSANLLRRIRGDLSYNPLIVIGYRGAENSIMKSLLIDGVDDCSRYPHGIWWCYINDDPFHSNILELGKSISNNMVTVKISGFDELMEEINTGLADRFGMANLVYNNTHIENKDKYDFNLDELDQSLIRTTIKEYCNRLNLDYEVIGFENFLLQLGLITKHGEVLEPTLAGYLLFAKDPKKKVHYSIIQLLNESTGESNIVEGNLLTQFDRIVEILNSYEMNPLIIIKKGKKSEEIRSYSTKALRELIVNALVHRNYSLNRYTKIIIKPSQEIIFETPGGLTHRLLQMVQRDSGGRFKPRKELKDYRNLTIADIFCGIGYMEKKGSGLIDAEREMIESGGEAEFKIDNENTTMTATLRMAKLQTSNVAEPIFEAEIYTTNYLPIEIIPKTLFTFSLNTLHDIKSYLASNSNDDSLIFYDDSHSVSSQFLSFFDIKSISSNLAQVSIFPNYEPIKIDEYLSSKINRNKFVALLNEHWRAYLAKYKDIGLILDPEKSHRRAYFILLKNEDNRIITYKSETGRKSSRNVVKKREGKRMTFCENEGFNYSFEQIGEEWFLRIKPFYMFTRADGQTPLAGFRRSKLSTRRIKFDKNKNVREDLIFWAKIFSENQSVFNIGYNDDQRLIINSNFLECESTISDEIDD